MMELGKGKGYTELTARRAWRYAGLFCQEDLFKMTDMELLRIPGIGRKTLKHIQQLRQEYLESLK